MLVNKKCLSFICACVIFVVDPDQNVEMAVHDAKTTYGHCKNLIKLFEALIEPIFPIVGSVVLEEPRGTYASRKQMIPASHPRIHKPKSSRSHRFISRTAEASIVPTRRILPQKQTLVNKQMPVLYFFLGD
jgi:hypothetical protein